jgi:hypothetical protein
MNKKMMLWYNLEEAAEWLSKKSGENFTTRDLLDAAYQNELRMDFLVPHGARLTERRGHAEGFAATPAAIELDFPYCFQLMEFGKTGITYVDAVFKRRPEVAKSTPPESTFRFEPPIIITRADIRIAGNELLAFYENIEIKEPESNATQNYENDTKSSIDKNEVIGWFPVRDDPHENERFWDDKLGDPPNWLIAARVKKGSPGISARWDALKVAECLLDNSHMHANNLRDILKSNCPDRLEEWDKQRTASSQWDGL